MRHVLLHPAMLPPRGGPSHLASRRFGADPTRRTKNLVEMQLPLEEIRVSGKVSPYISEEDRLAQCFIIWDKVKSIFKLRIETYGLHKTHRNNRFNAEREMVHGEMLGGDFIPGAIVDQKQKRILLPQGGYLDGATGDVFTTQGTRIFSRTQPDTPQKDL